MKERKKKYVALWQVMQRECRRLVSRPLYLFCMVIAPLFCYLFFTTLMDSGLPQNLPAGVVDMDDFVYFTQHCPQSGCFLANRCHSSLQQCYGCAHRCAGRKNLRFLLYPERLVGRSTKPAATQNLFLYQLLLSDCGLFAIQRYENDGRTYCRLCCQKYTVCQRSYGRSGNGFPATNRNRHASTEQSMAELFGIPV